MQPGQKVRAPLDRLLLGLLTRGWDEAAIKEYRGRLQEHEAAIPAPIAAVLQNLDAKATGLLTHVSMMIAGLGLIAPLVADHNLELAIVIAEMSIYLLIAVGCLRCLSVFRTHRSIASPSEFQEMIERELLLRRELYRLCIRLAIIFTVLVFITLPLMYLW